MRLVDSEVMRCMRLIGILVGSGDRDRVGGKSGWRNWYLYNS